MPPTIMVVDDSQMVRRQVSHALVAAGFDVVEAADGADALQQLTAIASPSLIVLDVNMPKMGGIEFLQTLRGKGQGAAMPAVVMLTTEGEPRLMQEAKALGAKGWIIKPFKPEMLVAAVQKLTQASDPKKQ
ncbi:MAG TPA: response regulator [Polyangiaceae bacterium]|jgi:two-component system chemotaxis response regulator CheY|nr:response regulator [Polyangiaceae bacterium]